MLGGGRNVDGNRTRSGKHNKPAMSDASKGAAPKTAKAKAAKKTVAKVEIQILSKEAEVAPWPRSSQA